MYCIIVYNRTFYVNIFRQNKAATDTGSDGFISKINCHYP